MKLKLIFSENILQTYHIIIHKLQILNSRYEDNIIIHENLRKMKNIINFLQRTHELIYNEDNENNEDNIYNDYVFKRFERFNIDNYQLINIDKFFYHIDNDLYITCVNLFNYLINIILTIKKFFVNLRTIINELNKTLENIVKPVLVLSSSSPNMDIKITLDKLNLKLKSDNINKEEIINEIINKLHNIKKNNKNILSDIKNILNIKNIFILDKIFEEKECHEFNCYLIKYRELLLEENDKTLKQIRKIIDLKLNEEKNENNILIDKYKKINKFLNSFDYIYINDIDKIYFLINKTNNIKKEISDSNLLNKELILNKIKYFSFSASSIPRDNIEINLNKFKSNFINFEDYSKIDFNVGKLMEIYELYNEIISKKIDDNSIKKNVKKILNFFVNLHNYNFLNFEDESFIFKFIFKRFNAINLHYNIDYDLIEINNNFETFKLYLEKLYLYKNYIIKIRDLFKFLLTIKDNFNLVYKTIDIIKNMIKLLKTKDNESITYLIRKINEISSIEFQNEKDIIKYLDNYLFNS
jgi:hypothetical protein